MTKQQALAEYENLGAQIQLMTLRRQKLRRTILGQEADEPSGDGKLELGGGGGSSTHGGHGGGRARAPLHNGQVSKGQVLEWMSSQGEVGAMMVRDRFGITVNAAYQHLNQLMHDKRVKRVGKGKYVVT